LRGENVNKIVKADATLISIETATATANSKPKGKEWPKVLQELVLLSIHDISQS
jgi:hypothetical protein